MKKILLSLGTIAAIAAPVASVIACGDPVNSSDEIKTINSTKTEAELKAIDLKTLENQEIPHLEEAFGITTGISAGIMVKAGITYDGSKLVFIAGPLDEEVTYTFVISHDQYITDTALRENVDVEGQNGSGVMTFGTMVGVESMHSDNMTGLSNGDRFPITIKYSDGYWGSPEITYEVVGLPSGETGA